MRKHACVCVQVFWQPQIACFPAIVKNNFFLLQQFANSRSTKALRDSAAVHESQPTPAILGASVAITLLCIFVVLRCVFVVLRCNFGCFRLLRAETVFRTGSSVAIRGYRGSIRAWRGGRYYPYLTTYNLALDKYIFISSHVFERKRAGMLHLIIFHLFVRKKARALYSIRAGKGGRGDCPLSLSDQT